MNIPEYQQTLDDQIQSNNLQGRLAWICNDTEELRFCKQREAHLFEEYKMVTGRDYSWHKDTPERVVAA